MHAIRAERVTETPGPRGLTTAYGVLDRRQTAELSAPGALRHGAHVSFCSNRRHQPRSVTPNLIIE